MSALHKSTTYKPLDIPNPFREGQDKAYADILQDKMNEMRWWRRTIGVGFLALFAICILLFVWALRQQKTIPVLINVMPSGEAQYLGEVRQTSAPQVPEAAIQYQLRRFITNLRSVSTDPQVLYNNIDECYSMITSTYEPLMTRTLRASSPFDLVGKLRRTVEIESVLKITGASWQLDWSESTFENSHERRGLRMRALITVKILPVNEANIRKNPLGIYIENCEMTRL
jgi:type IV secretion system protein VirB5